MAPIHAMHNISCRSHLVFLFRVVVARHIHILLLELVHESLELGIFGLADDFGLRFSIVQKP